jgi:hypothetical protein
MKKSFERYSSSLTRFGRNGFLSRSIYAIQWDVVRTVLFVALFGSFAFAQDRTALTLNQISDLLKNGVSSTRIAKLVEQRGVSFELNETALRRLRADGADDVVLSTVKRMAARYTEEQQRKRLDAERKKQEETRQAEEVKRRAQEQAKLGEVDKRRAEKSSRQESVELGKRRPPEEARQRPQKDIGATLMLQEDVGRVASLRNVMSAEGGEVSGEVANNTKQTLRDVQLQIVYSWRWNNEYHPGKDDPGTARYYVLNQEISPGQTVRFNYKPSPPLASRDDGQFDISVKIVSFAQVFQPGAQR